MTFWLVDRLLPSLLASSATTLTLGAWLHTKHRKLRELIRHLEGRDEG